MKSPVASDDKPLVLIVDDDEASRLLLRFRLEREGYRVIEAENGEQALAAYQKFWPDMVLLDYMMPVMDGITTCRRIQRLPGSDSIPVLMVTALEDSQTVDLAFEAGATDFITKPITWPVLRQRVRRLLRVKQSDQLLQLRDRAIAAASSGIVITDATRPGQPIIYVNPACERLTGYHATEMIGHTCRVLYGTGTDPKTITRIEQALQAGQEASVVIKSYRKDGSVYWADMTVAPVRDWSGKITHFVWVQQDITGRVKREVEQQSQLLQEQALVNVVKELNQSTALDRVLHTAMEQAVQALNGSGGALFLLDNESGRLHLNSSQGIPGEVVEAIKRAPDKWGVAGRAARTGTEVLVANILKEHPEQGKLALHGNMRAQLSLPLHAAGRVVGVISIHDGRARYFSSRDVALVNAIADQVVKAIERAQLYETLREQSIRDPLTGLFNRRYLEESLEREIERARRRGRPLGVIMVDLDHFKQVNDNFGHDAGDVLLRRLGGYLQRSASGREIACKYGGEEFTLILPDSTLEQSSQRAEALRSGIRTISSSFRDQPLAPISLSLGVAIFPNHGQNSRELLRAADEALYRAKAEGRNRVVVQECSHG